MQPAGGLAAALVVTGFATLAAQLYQRCLIEGIGNPLHVPEDVDIRVPTLGVPSITGED